MKKVLSVLMAVLMLTAVFAVAVSAEEYPSISDRDYYVVYVDVDGNGTANVDPVTPKKDGDTAKLVAKPGNGAEFSGWTFEGEFEWVEGDANSLVIVIRPLGDVKFVAHFKDGAKTDGGKTSPTTGYNTSAIIAAIAVVLTISAAVVVVNGKRYFSAK